MTTGSISRSRSTWIPVDEALPPLDVPVLVKRHDGERTIDRRLTDPSPNFSHWAGARTDEVTHWMHIPE
jgi:hypothetical protein